MNSMIFSCPKCKATWRYRVEKCIYCHSQVVATKPATATVIGVTKVMVPTHEHPDVPYFDVLSRDASGAMHITKTHVEPQLGSEFQLVKKESKLRVGIAGSGAMGTGIALTCLLAGVPVVVYSRSSETVARSRAMLEKKLARNLDEKQVADLLQRATFTNDLASLREVDVVIENVSEDLAIKQVLFEQLAAACSSKTIITSNTSSLLIRDIASRVPKQTKPRVAGFHFFNPVEKMALVEIISTSETNSATLKVLEELALLLGKVPVMAKDTPGFIVNRVLMPLLQEAVELVGEKAASPEEIDKAVKLGLNHPMGPLALLDLIGIDVFIAIQRNLQKETNDKRFKVHPLLLEMVKQNKTGVKTGEGFYTYAKK